MIISIIITVYIMINVLCLNAGQAGAGYVDYVGFSFGLGRNLIICNTYHIICLYALVLYMLCLYILNLNATGPRNKGYLCGEFTGHR